MCLEHDKHEHNRLGVSRRGFGSMLAGAAGLSLLPLAARAGTVDTLCVTCIDYRFVNRDVTWLNTELGLQFDNYDIVALAGGALAAIKTAVPQTTAGFWDQIKIAISLHHIKKVVLVDHMDCGAYRVAYGTPPSNPQLPPAEELARHKIVMPQVAKLLQAAPYNLQASCYLMPLVGPPTAIPV
jgi:carbonic anhydrase